MDVSKTREASDPAANTEIAGEKLLETLANLSGLTKPTVCEVLDLSQDGAQSLTLDQLRQAMLSYLEALGPEFGNDEDLSDESSDAAIKRLS